MKLSTRARYALRAMILIAREGSEETPINLAEVARRSGVSYRYLEQISIALKHAKLLRAIPGKSGGHLLARPAEEIKLLEIVEAVIGEINVVECVGEPESCLKSGECECRELYGLINDRIRDALASSTLADLEQGKVKREGKRKRKSNHGCKRIIRTKPIHGKSSPSLIAPMARHSPTCVVRSGTKAIE